MVRVFNAALYAGSSVLAENIRTAIDFGEGQEEWHGHFYLPMERIPDMMRVDRIRLHDGREGRITCTSHEEYTIRFVGHGRLA
jgi:hypothetical protein